MLESSSYKMLSLSMFVFTYAPLSDFQIIYFINIFSMTFNLQFVSKLNTIFNSMVIIRNWKIRIFDAKH